MASLTLNTRIPLNDGNSIPQFGLGVFQLENGPECERAVTAALEAGVRHIDTAAVYGNEEAVGRALAASGIPREDLFVTTKCWIDDFGRDAARRAFDASRRKLGLDVIDLYLLHWPVDDTMMAAWETLVELRAKGHVRSIGVSNFTVRRFEQFFLRHTDIVPAVNQVEFHPFLYQQELLQYCHERKIKIESYCPIARAEKTNAPILQRLSKKYGKTPVQVILRWQIEHKLIPLPRSMDPDHIKANTEVFDFALPEEEVEEINRLDEGYRLITPEKSPDGW